jgi:hypothetical protein
MSGARTWFFPDGYLPEKTGGKFEAHESLMILNVTESDADILLSVYFEDRRPVRDISLSVPAERIRSFRLDRSGEIGGCVIPPLTQYALRVLSSVPVICQFGRLDTSQANLSYYGSDGFSE